MSKKKIIFFVSIVVIVLATIVVASVAYVKIKNRNSGVNTIRDNVISNQRGSATDQLSDLQKAELEKDLKVLEQKIKSQPDNSETRTEQALEIQGLMKKYNLR